MKALIMTAYHSPLEVADWPDPDCPRDGVILRLEACGVCRSDHHAWAGVDPDVSLPHIMGHEFAGIVEEAGPDTRFQRGDRITAPFILSCGTCEDCEAGQATICAHQHCVGFSGPGAFAQYLPIPHADFNAVRLPDAVEMPVAAAMGCRVTTAWRALVDRAKVQPGEWVVIHGCGGVGLSAVSIAKALGARVIGIDPSPAARALATELGADAVLSADRAADAVCEITRGGAHISIDALGITATFDASLRSLRKLGRHVQVGMPVGSHANVQLPLLDLIYARQLAMYGMRGLDAAGFQPLVKLVANGTLDLSDMITSEIPLSGVEAVLREMDDGAPTGVAVVTDFTR